MSLNNVIVVLFFKGVKSVIKACMTIFLVNCLDCVKGEREGEAGERQTRCNTFQQCMRTEEES